jgi:hypothetical protein
MKARWEGPIKDQCPICGEADAMHTVLTSAETCNWRMEATCIKWRSLKREATVKGATYGTK